MQVPSLAPRQLQLLASAADSPEGSNIELTNSSVIQVRGLPRAGLRSMRPWRANTLSHPGGLAPGWWPAEGATHLVEPSGLLLGFVRQGEVRL